MTTLTGVRATFEADSSYFTDTSGNVHEASIDALAALGISVGFPDQPLRRPRRLRTPA
jgi:hypothetical protein